MRKLFLFALMLFSISFVKAQDVVDDFNVGPYEVVYKGQGDINFRLKKGVDLYEYFGLKKDTIIQVLEEKPVPLKHGFLLSFHGETTTTRSNSSMVYSIEATWKQRFSQNTFFNGGLLLGYAATTNSNLEENVLEAGIPLSIEWSGLNSKRGSLYCGLGLIPTYYSTLSAKYVSSHKGVEPEKYNGLYIAPNFDFGGYIPVGKQLVKVGVSCRYKINCSTKECDIYGEILGKAFVGANVGLVF